MLDCSGGYISSCLYGVHTAAELALGFNHVSGALWGSPFLPPHQTLSWNWRPKWSGREPADRAWSLQSQQEPTICPTKPPAPGLICAKQSRSLKSSSSVELCSKKRYLGLGAVLPLVVFLLPSSTGCTRSPLSSAWPQVSAGKPQPRERCTTITQTTCRDPMVCGPGRDL